MVSSARNVNLGIPLSTLDVDDLIRRLDERSEASACSTELGNEDVFQIEIEGVRYLIVRCSPDRVLGWPSLRNTADFAAAADSDRTERVTDERIEEARGPEVDDPALGRASRSAPPLSPRELEVARMVAKGYADKSIAAILEISRWTVSSHLRRIYMKLGVNSRAAMVARLLASARDDHQ